MTSTDPCNSDRHIGPMVRIENPFAERTKKGLFRRIREAIYGQSIIVAYLADCSAFECQDCGSLFINGE